MDAPTAETGRVNWSAVQMIAHRDFRTFIQVGIGRIGAVARSGAVGLFCLDFTGLTGSLGTAAVIGCTCPHRKWALGVIRENKVLRDFLRPIFGYVS